MHELKHTFGRGLRRTGDGGRQEGPAGSQERQHHQPLLGGGAGKTDR